MLRMLLEIEQTLGFPVSLAALGGLGWAHARLRRSVRILKANAQIAENNAAEIDRGTRDAIRATQEFVSETARDIRTSIHELESHLEVFKENARVGSLTVTEDVKIGGDIKIAGNLATAGNAVVDGTLRANTFNDHDMPARRAA